MVQPAITHDSTPRVDRKSPLLRDTDRRRIVAIPARAGELIGIATHARSKPACPTPAPVNAPRGLH